MNRHIKMSSHKKGEEIEGRKRERERERERERGTRTQRKKENTREIRCYHYIRQIIWFMTQAQAPDGCVLVIHTASSFGKETIVIVFAKVRFYLQPSGHHGRILPWYWTRRSLQKFRRSFLSTSLGAYLPPK